MKIVELPQGGNPEWLAWRSVGLGGSDAPIIMGKGLYGRTLDDLMAEKAEALRRSRNRPGLARLKTEPRPYRANPNTRWGQEMEPRVRDLYQRLTGLKTRPVCVVHDDYDWLRASLDGLSDDDQIILEIKCTKKEYHQQALDDQVPDHFIPQLQHQLLVSGCPRLHYWSYNEARCFKTIDRVALVTVEPDPEYQKDLLDQERTVWEEIKKRADH